MTVDCLDRVTIYVVRAHGGEKMCSLCWEANAAGYMTRTEVWQCVYYLDMIRNNRDELRRIPKRDPDDPYYRLQYGEGILSFTLSLDDYKDWYYLKYLPSWRRRVYRLKASGKGADAPEERAARGVEDETKWVAETTLTDF